MAKKPKPADFDQAQFDRMKDLQQALESDYSERDAFLDELDQYWSMIPLEPIPQDTTTTAVTYDTDMTNRLMGAHRLLTATEPQWSVPYDTNNPEAAAIASPAERLAKMMWEASGKQRGMPLEKDAVLSALHRGQVDIALTNMLEEDIGEEGDDNVAYWRKKAMQQRSPMMFEVLDPRQGYPLRDKFGVQYYGRAYETTVAQFRAEWGEDVDLTAFTVNQSGGQMAPLDRIRIRDGVNERVRYAWIQGQNRPFYSAENRDGIVPIHSQIADGTLLFQDVKLQARPFLYTAHKSGIAQRQSLALTAIFTIIKAIAMSAAWKHTSPQGKKGKALQVRQVGPLSVYELEFGEALDPMLSKGAIDPGLLTALEIGNQKIAESTIYSQALGEPLGANAPFSMVALLHQAGRLPLTAPKVLTGWACSSAMELAFLWMKATGKTISASNAGQTVEISASEIPFDIQFGATLEIDLPQDMREIANAVKGLEGVVSQEWIRENVMRGVGQSDAMQEQIWSEQMANMMAMQTLQMFQALSQMPEGQTLTGGNGSEQPPPVQPRERPVQNQQGFEPRR